MMKQVVAAAHEIAAIAMAKRAPAVDVQMCDNAGSLKQR
jgi:hypothetical protein